LEVLFGHTDTRNLWIRRDGVGTQPRGQSLYCLWVEDVVSHDSSFGIRQVLGSTPVAKMTNDALVIRSPKSDDELDVRLGDIIKVCSFKQDRVVFLQLVFSLCEQLAGGRVVSCEEPVGMLRRFIAGRTISHYQDRHARPT